MNGDRPADLLDRRTRLLREHRGILREISTRSIGIGRLRIAAPIGNYSTKSAASTVVWPIGGR
jgi:hypothetical protein